MMTYDDLKISIERYGVHPALGPIGEGWNIEQNPHELAVFLEDMLERGVSKVLEIGSGYRMGLSRFLANDLGWQVVSIDPIQPQFTAPNVQYLMGTSQILRPLFEGAQFDLVIIDGANTYEDVQRDYDMYVQLATKAIAICKIGGNRGCDGVARFWHELEIMVREQHVLAAGDEASGIGWYNVAQVEAEALPYFENGKGWVDEPPADDLDAVVHEAVEPDKYTLAPDTTWLNEPTAVDDEAEVKPKAKTTRKRTATKRTKKAG